MGKDFFTLIETIVGLIVAVAIIALLVSPKATTASVIQASGSALGNNLAVAESPVTGATYQVNLSYPSETPWSSSPYMG
jgi:type II secretory pathway pseudopilin PulG